MGNLRLSKSPNYDELPIATFNIAGTLAVLPLPEHTGSAPMRLASTDIDPDSHAWANPENPSQEGYLDLIYRLSWDITGSRNDSYLGSLLLNVFIMENRSNTFDFLSEESFKSWMIKRNSENYGPLNEEIRKERELEGLECEPVHLAYYAKEPDDIFAVTVNDRKWFGEKSGFFQNGTEIALSFRTPLNSKYSLNLEFDWSATIEAYDTVKAEIDDLQLEYLQKVRLIPNT